MCVLKMKKTTAYILDRKRNKNSFITGRLPHGHSIIIVPLSYNQSDSQSFFYLNGLRVYYEINN